MKRGFLNFVRRQGSSIANDDLLRTITISGLSRTCCTGTGSLHWQKGVCVHIRFYDARIPKSSSDVKFLHLHTGDPNGAKHQCRRNIRTLE